jgi:hypothetical protein
VEGHIERFSSERSIRLLESLSRPRTYYNNCSVARQRHEAQPCRLIGERGRLVRSLWRIAKGIRLRLRERFTVQRVSRRDAG